MAKFYFLCNDPLLILPGNKQDLGHENIVSTYLFYQVCKVNGIVCFGDQSTNAEKSWYLIFRHFCLKLVSWMVTALDTGFRQKCPKLRCHDFSTPILRSDWGTPPPPPGKGLGTKDWDTPWERTWDQRLGYSLHTRKGPETRKEPGTRDYGVPPSPPPVDKLGTLPSRGTTYEGGNNWESATSVAAIRVWQGLIHYHNFSPSIFYSGWSAISLLKRILVVRSAIIFTDSSCSTFINREKSGISIY